MGTPHISASVEDISKNVILVNNPDLSEYIANVFFDDAVIINEIRGMKGYTGRYNDIDISVLSVGIGIPSVSIYTNELLGVYGVKKIIYLTECYLLQKDISLDELILASGCCTDNDFLHHIFPGDFAPIADYGMLQKASALFNESNIPYHVGLLLSSDILPEVSNRCLDIWNQHSVLGVDMASAAVYVLAAKFSARALCISHTNDNSFTEETMKVTVNTLLKTLINA